MNWLIAEDEADIRNLVGIMCTVWGHTPITFESGQKVWEWLDQVEAGDITTACLTSPSWTFGCPAGAAASFPSVCARLKR